MENQTLNQTISLQNAIDMVTNEVATTSLPRFTYLNEPVYTTQDVILLLNSIEQKGDDSEKLDEIIQKIKASINYTMDTFDTSDMVMQGTLSFEINRGNEIELCDYECELGDLCSEILNEIEGIEKEYIGQND